MSASDPNSKIDLLDSADEVAKKIKKANAPPKQVEDNGLLSSSMSFFPLLHCWMASLNSWWTGEKASRLSTRISKA